MILQTQYKKDYSWVKEIGLDWSSVLCDLNSLEYSNQLNHIIHLTNIKKITVG